MYSSLTHHLPTGMAALFWDTDLVVTIAATLRAADVLALVGTCLMYKATLIPLMFRKAAAETHLMGDAKLEEIERAGRLLLLMVRSNAFFHPTHLGLPLVDYGGVVNLELAGTCLWVQMCDETGKPVAHACHSDRPNPRPTRQDLQRIQRLLGWVFDPDAQIGLDARAPNAYVNGNPQRPELVRVRALPPKVPIVCHPPPTTLG